MMTLSPSTAKIERSFSSMKAIKTCLKTNMDQSTLQWLMRVNDLETSVLDFDPAPVIDHWLTDTKRKRRIMTDNTVNKPAHPACQIQHLLDQEIEEIEEIEDQ